MHLLVHPALIKCVFSRLAHYIQSNATLLLADMRSLLCF